LILEGPTITWIKVQKPTLDLVGVILGSILLTVVLALVAALGGLLVGMALIRRRRRELAGPASHLTQLHLPDDRRS
jgi:hypothetical protein